VNHFFVLNLTVYHKKRVFFIRLLSKEDKENLKALLQQNPEPTVALSAQKHTRNNHINILSMYH